MKRGYRIPYGTNRYKNLSRFRRYPVLIRILFCYLTRDKVLDINYCKPTNLAPFRERWQVAMQRYCIRVGIVVPVYLLRPLLLSFSRDNRPSVPDVNPDKYGCYFLPD